MNHDVHEMALRLMHKGYDLLTEREKRVIGGIANRVHISRNVRAEFDKSLSFGQRMADKMASFGGSWTFILSFLAVLVAWVVMNSVVLARWQDTFDPFPYILLNLVLSMMASIQAPVIMMSQNRQAAKDREDAAHDYEVNLKAELEIMALHEKIDTLRVHQWEDLVKLQQEQIEMLKRLLDARDGA